MLNQRILHTLRMFGLLQVAPTLLEVYKFLVQDQEKLKLILDERGEFVETSDVGDSVSGIENLEDIRQALESLVLAGEAVREFGYYSLKESSELPLQRWRGHFFGSLREQRIRKFIGGLRFLPFVRGVGLAGSQSLGLEQKTSDIDLFIIAKKGKIWQVRTLVTAYFQILGVRRYGNKIANRFCLNHYITEGKVIQQGRNWYSAMEYGKLRALVFGSGIVSYKRDNSKWLKIFFPQLYVKKVQIERQTFLQQFLEKLLDNAIGEKIEVWLKDWQIKKIRLTDPHTTASEDELFFSPHSKEDRVVPAFLKSL